MLIAMTVLLLAFSATMMLLPGIQNNTVDTEVAVEALNMVERTLENQQALARKDFKLVNGTTSQETVGNLTYQKVVTAQSTDYFTKEVTATVSWGGMYGRAQSMTLKTVVSNFEQSVGGDTCDSILTDSQKISWASPQVTHKTLGAQIMGDASGLYPITDIDAYRKRLYVGMNTTGTLPSIGPKDGGTFSNDSSVGTVGWANVTNARLNDSAYATASLGNAQTSNYIKATNFGFTIPADATIVGIKVDIDRKGSSNSNTVQDNAVRIIRADGSLGGTNRATTGTPCASTWGTSDCTQGYGGTNDLWGETGWSPSAINDADFGVALSAVSLAGSGSRTASVDHIKVTVTYTRQFSVLNISTPTNPTFDKALGSNIVSQGFTSIAIATSTSAGSYAYVTTASTTAQFQVINLTPTPAIVLSTYKIPNATGLIPNTLFYKDGYVYVGFPNNSGGPEFYIIDVHDPSSLPTPLATFEVGRGINTIYVKSGYAFIATDNPAKELIVLDLNNLASPVLRGNGYNAPGSDTSTFGLGKALYTVGDTLYFGRYYISSDPELAVLDTTADTPTLLGSKDVNGLTETRGVYSAIVRSNFAFLFTGNATGSGTKLQIYNVANPANITTVTSSDLIGSSEPRGFDCESNYVYAASVPSSNKGSISIITAP